MELLQAIALLCQMSQSNTIRLNVYDAQLECQQTYLNCVLKRNTWEQSRALQQCVLEK